MGPPRPAIAPVWIAAAAVVTCAAIVYEAGSFRLARSDGEVRLARTLQARSRAWKRFAVEHAWRMGGHLYLRPAELIAVEAPAQTHDPADLVSDVSLEAVALRTRTCRALSCETAFAAGGYAAVAVSDESAYRVFSRTTISR